jgi:high-affinity nickel-transport protein
VQTGVSTGAIAGRRRDRTSMATVGVGNAFHIGLVLTAFGFGFRHGIDWDHIAALTDITSSQEEPRRSLWFATLYALGHALVVFVLGLAAIVLAQRLPDGVDAVMERFVGATLVVLGCYVFYALVRHGRDFRMRSRWMLMLTGVRRGVHWIRSHGGARSELVDIEHDHVHPLTDPHDLVHQREDVVVLVGTASGSTALDHHRHRHRHVIPLPDDPFANYAPRTAFGIGMIHGIGAETPTQVLIFVTAAGAGGKGSGFLLLVAFLVGLLSSNSAIAVAGTFGLLGAARNFSLYVAVSCITALFSLVIGSMFLVGSAALLPAMLGG